MRIILQIDNEVRENFYNMELFVKYYGYLCSTLYISSINYSHNNSDTVYVCITTIQNALKTLDLEMEYE